MRRAHPARTHAAHSRTQKTHSSGGTHTHSHMPPPSSQAKLSSNRQSKTLTGITEESLVVVDVPPEEELDRGGLHEPFERRGKIV